MDPSATLDTLNELLAVEQRHAAPRLLESTVFVSDLSAPALDTVRRMTRCSREHCASLVKLILSLGGNPWPRAADIASADWHFQELGHGLPQLAVGLTELIRTYSRAVEHVAGEPRAESLVAAILAHHRADLAALQTLSGGAVALKS